MSATSTARTQVPTQASESHSSCATAAVSLTAREVTVLTLLAEGMTAQAISRRLGIRVATVSKHQENLYRKLGTRDRLNTVLLARDLGLLPQFHPRVRL
ncbi:response regulator transcription factor [Krasilnikovia sp. MM14-A1004]|uniref:response regulator transcription factor n=1 Tax=Krasilnikovia sp. MM14-A1004 TaxID=3373541 RepID=UPI00399CF2E5